MATPRIAEGAPGMAPPMDGTCRIYDEEDGWFTLRLPLSRDISYGWRWKLEIDDRGWWLVHDGRRRNRNPWTPADEWEALAACKMLYMLNEAGDVPVVGTFREVAERLGQDVAGLQWMLEKAAYGLLVRKLIR